MIARCHWSGERLHGPATRSCEVVVPARLVAFMADELPAAAPELLRQACLLRARRHFAALLPARIDACIGAPLAGRCPVLAMALPEQQVAAIETAARERNLRVRAIRVAELCQPVPADGIVRSEGEGCLLRCNVNGDCCDLQVLGRQDAPDFAERLRRARLGDDAPTHAAAAPGLRIDLLHPHLERRQPLWQRSGPRIAALVATILLLAVLAAALGLADTVEEHRDLRARLHSIAPQVEALRRQRLETRALAPWFDQRSGIEAALVALADALARHSGPADIYLTRFRRHDGRRHSAEGVARSRAAVMAYVERLRARPGVEQVDIRSLSGSGKEGAPLAFELDLAMEGAARADP